MQVFNPYPQLGEQLASGLTSIAIAMDPANPTIEDFIDAVYSYVQPIYYPSASTQIEIEVKSVIYNMINAYNNKAIGNTIVYNEKQMFFIQMMLRTSNEITPINAIDSKLMDIEDNVSKSGLSLEEQTPLLLGIEFGKSIYEYWVIKTETPDEWDSFFQSTFALNYSNIPFWISACMNGALIGANASQKGLIAPTTDIVSVNIISSLIGALSIGAGKVIFKWIPEIQPTELIATEGMFSGGFSEVFSADFGEGLVQLKKDNKCRTNSQACNNIQCTNNCTNTGTCTSLS